MKIIEIFHQFKAKADIWVALLLSSAQVAVIFTVLGVTLKQLGRCR